MKKLSKQRKAVLDRRSRNIKGHKKKEGQKTGNDNSNKLHLPSFNLGERMNFSDDIDTTIGVFKELKDFFVIHPNAYVNFNKLKTIDTSAALVLASEFDIRRLKRKSKWSSPDISSWQEQPKQQLKDMGFFELLNVSAKDISTRSISPADERFVQFIRGDLALGNKSIELRKDINEIINDRNIENIWPQAGITEAMTNCVQHAYDDESNKYKYWWLSAGFHYQEKSLTITIFDRGVGIPETVPKKWKWQVPFLRYDADYINWAVEHGNTSKTEDPQRGQGLHEIKDYIDKSDRKAYLKIISNRGFYFYEKLFPSGKAKETSKNFKKSLNGTLIEWKIWL